MTYQQLGTLLERPQMPQLRIDSAQLSDFIAVDFYDVLPVAAGVVLVKAPGHTPGEIMVYAVLENGREYVFTGDVSWSYQGIREVKQKPRAQVDRIGEDAKMIRFQLEWLNRLMATDIQLLVSHDDIVQPSFVKKGLLSEGLLIR